MKALWISDLHIEDSVDSLSERVLGFILETAISENVDIIINTGDTFDNHNNLKATELSIYRDFLMRATKFCKVYSVVGNHDYGREYDVHALQSFYGIENHVVVDTSMNLCDVGHPDIYLMSYSRTKDRFLELSGDIINCRALFGHFDMDGFELGSDRVESGSWSTPELYARFGKVFSGHYHKAQKDVKSGVEIEYLGSPMSHSFGEADQSKRIAVIDLNTLSVKSIETPFNLHRKIEIRATDRIPELDANEVARGVQYWVKIYGTELELKEVRVPVSYPARIEKIREDEPSIRLDLTKEETDEDVIRKYVEHEIKRQFGDVSSSPLDIGRLLGLGTLSVKRGAFD